MQRCPERQEYRSVWFLWMVDGEWMRNWEESCKEAGANLVCDSVICQEEPDDEATDACKALGAALV